MQILIQITSELIIFQVYVIQEVIIKVMIPLREKCPYSE